MIGSLPSLPKNSYAARSKADPAAPVPKFAWKSDTLFTLTGIPTGPMGALPINSAREVGKGEMVGAAVAFS